MIISENFPYTNEFFKIFDDICKIPHGSGNTSGIAKYCMDYAENCGCEAKMDSAGNVIIKRPAGEGYEGHEPIIIQGHLDMVCDKTPDSDHDFTCDPLKISFDGKYITADNTTLGGDDGIAVAFGLALIKDKDLQLPPLEILLTTDEETGLYGAAGLDGSLIFGKKLLNLDSEEEGTLLCGCAGGVTAYVTKDFSSETLSGTVATVTVSGLAGGHSGVEIHKRRLNAAKVMVKLLNNADCDYRLVLLVSGTKINVIPSNCVAKVLIDTENADAFKERITKIKDSIAIFSAEDRLDVSFKTEDGTVNAISVDDSKKLIEYLDTIQDGVIKEGITGVVTSLNIGVTDFADGKFSGASLIRSMDNSDLNTIADSVCDKAVRFGFEYKASDFYPAWEYNEVSPLRDKAVSVYEKLYGIKPVVTTIHAGLECGLISEKIPGIDAVSFGPNILDVHTVNEKLDVESTVRTWEYLVELLKNI